MSNNPSDFSHILRPPISTPRSNRDHWRQIFLVLRALIAIADNTKKGSYLDGVSPSSPSAYTVLHIHEPGEVAGISPTVSHKSLDDVHPPNDVNEHHDVIIIRRSLSQLARIVKQKDLLSLQQFGAVEEIAAFLNTDLEKGIHGGAEDQHPPFKNWNTLGPVKDFIHFFFKACKSATIVLLLFCAALSLGFELKEEGPENGWYDGVTILVAVFLFVTVSATLNFWHARKLHKQPNKKKTVIEVVRDGQPRRISSSDVVVGDIVCLKPGDLVPADGLLLSGCSLKVDEVLDSIIDHYHNPFLFSGAKVINGHGRMVVISLGSNTAMGEMMSWVTRDPYDETTLLQARLDKLGSYTQNIGLLIAILILVALFMRYKLGKKDDETGYPELKGKITAIKELMKAFERIIVKPKGRIGVLTTTLTISLVGMQEGLPFVITLSLSYWSKRNICDKAIVKELSTCVTMGSVTTICTEITGGLTSNQVEVDMFMIGEEAINGWDFEIAPGVIEALGEGVGLSVMAPETSTSPRGELLLPWAEKMLGTNTEQLKQNCTILKSKPSLNSDKKASGVLMKKNDKDGNVIRLHWKGDAATILTMCSHYYDRRGAVKVMDEQKKQQVFDKVIGEIGVKGLESIAFAYKQIDFPIPEEDCLEEDGLIMLGLVGIKDPCAEARTTVEAYINAGVNVILVSGDDMSVVRAIAIACGIMRPNSNLEVLEAEDFRNLSSEEKMVRVDQVSAMASSLPDDKLLMVQCLREKRQVVAVVGFGRNDCPALKEADVGISMGTRISEMAKNNSDIVILDNSFSSLTTIFKSGRSAYVNIQKFIQLELTTTIAGLLINSISTVSWGEAPITPLQLFWVHLVVGTLGGLALMTEAQTHQDLMEKPPVFQTELLITKAIWRNIISQALYQTIILLTFQGQSILGMDQKTKKTMIFNIFLLCQVFNQLNARELEKKNVFKGIQQNNFFLIAFGFNVGLQGVVVEFANGPSGCVRLGWKEWAACFLTAMVSLGIDWSVKCIWGLIADHLVRQSVH